MSGPVYGLTGGSIDAYAHKGAVRVYTHEDSGWVDLSDCDIDALISKLVWERQVARSQREPDVSDQGAACPTSTARQGGSATDGRDHDSPGPVADPLSAR